MWACCGCDAVTWERKSRYVDATSGVYVCLCEGERGREGVWMRVSRPLSCPVKKAFLWGETLVNCGRPLPLSVCAHAVVQGVCRCFGLTLCLRWDVGNEIASLGGLPPSRWRINQWESSKARKRGERIRGRENNFVAAADWRGRKSLRCSLPYSCLYWSNVWPFWEESVT